MINHRQFLSVLEILSSDLYVHISDNLSSEICIELPSVNLIFCLYFLIVTPCSRFWWTLIGGFDSCGRLMPADMEKVLHHVCVVLALR